MNWLHYIPLPSIHHTTVWGCAFLLSWLITKWILIRHLSIGIDKPDGIRKMHGIPISRLGGLPIFVTLICGFMHTAWKIPGFLEVWWPLILCNTLIFLIGFLDDLKAMGAKVKLLGQFGVAAILYSFDFSIDKISNPFGEGSIMLGWWSFPITILWLVAIPNIINLIDGMDGLASGLGLFLCVTLGFIGHFAGLPVVVTLSVVMTGALAGFLYFNFPPAKIFLGDGGAYLIGFFIASVSLFSSQKGTIVAAFLVVFIALGVPILDTSFAIIRRAVRGVPIFRADAEHIHHRLILLGFSKTRALIAMYSVGLALSLIAISIFWIRGYSLAIAGGALALLWLGAARYLGYIKSWRSFRSQFNLALARRKEMTFTTTYAKVLEHEVEKCQSREEFYQVFFYVLDRLNISVNPVEGWIPVQVSLFNDKLWTTYIAPKNYHRELSIPKVECLVSSLLEAINRWGIPKELQIQTPSQPSIS